MVINDNFQNNTPKPLDAKYLKANGILYQPYSSIADVNASISTFYRHQGLTVLVNDGGTFTEYWYKDGTANEHLVVKSGGSAPSYGYVNGLKIDGENVEFGGLLDHNTSLDGNQLLLDYSNFRQLSFTSATSLDIPDYLALLSIAHNDNSPLVSLYSSDNIENKNHFVNISSDRVDIGSGNLESTIRLISVPENTSPEDTDYVVTIKDLLNGALTVTPVTDVSSKYENGLTKDAQTVKLGGALTDPITFVELDGNQLLIGNTGASTSSIDIFANSTTISGGTGLVSQLILAGNNITVNAVPNTSALIAAGDYEDFYEPRSYISKQFFDNSIATLMPIYDDGKLLYGDGSNVAAQTNSMLWDENDKRLTIDGSAYFMGTGGAGNPPITSEVYNVPGNTVGTLHDLSITNTNGYRRRISFRSASLPNAAVADVDTFLDIPTTSGTIALISQLPVTRRGSTTLTLDGTTNSWIINHGGSSIPSQIFFKARTFLTGTPQTFDSYAIASNAGRTTSSFTINITTDAATAIGNDTVEIDWIAHFN